LDENIDKAMHNLHMPVRQLSETQEKYNTQQAASAHLYTQWKK